jgi:hypothetical protein
MTRHIIAVVALAAFVACGSVEGQTITSPDKRYRAEEVRTNGKHYQIVEVASGRVVLTTAAQFASPNDVKHGEFGKSPGGEIRFAACYHYDHAGRYTWIGIWALDGRLVHSTTRPQWTTEIGDAFRGEKAAAGGS